MILLLVVSVLGIVAIVGAIHVAHVDGYRRVPVRSAWQDCELPGSH